MQTNFQIPYIGVQIIHSLNGWPALALHTAVSEITRGITVPVGVLKEIYLVAETILEKIHNIVLTGPWL